MKPIPIPFPDANATGQRQQIDTPAAKVAFLLPLFYVLVFVVVGRPQDILTFLSALRPALILEVLAVLLALMNFAQLFSNASFRNRQVTLYFALIALMIIGIPFAVHRGQTFMFVFTEYISVIFFFFLFFVIATSTGVLKSILKVACFSIAAYLAFSLLGGTLSGGRLGVGKMFDPNDLAYLFVSFIPLNFLFLARGNRIYVRCVAVFNIAFGSLAVLMTGSRGGLIGLLVAFIMLLFSKTRSVKFGYKVTFIVLCLALVWFKSGSIDFERLGTTFEPENDYNVTDEFGRADLWKIGMRLMLTHPLTGVGASCFEMSVAQDRQDRGMIPRYQTAHNSFVLIGAETGIIGFVLFILLNFYAFRIFSKVARNGPSEEMRRIAEMARIGFLGNFACSMFLSQSYSIYWVFFIVTSAVLDRLAQRGRESLNGQRNLTPREAGPV
ncbi:MAG: O-antigen ligase family protein [Syntrophorhabdales bacterium]|jgi:O-antigen ligase